jgi:hypothetical protein
VTNRKHIFEIFPNPATDYSQIWFESPLVSDCYLTVYSMDGRVISNDIIKAGTNIYRLDTRSYVQGLYVINLFSDKDFLQSKRILVNRIQH